MITSSQLLKLNEKGFKVVKSYQNISIGSKYVSTPYFINTVEGEYSKAMRKAGVRDDLILKTMNIIKSGNTLIGKYRGKGSPQEIEEDLQRLSIHLRTKNFDLEKQPIFVIREFMKTFHIGIDCSGFVYNLLLLIDPGLFEKLKGNLDWPKFEWDKGVVQSASRAGTKVFNSDRLITVDAVTEIQPLDLVIWKDNSHMGILLEVKGDMCLAHSSPDEDGVALRKFQHIPNKFTIKRFPL